MSAVRLAVHSCCATLTARHAVARGFQGGVAAAILLLATSGYSRAALITSLAEMPSLVGVVDFSQYASQSGLRYTLGPEQVGGVIGEDILFTSEGGAGFLGLATFYYRPLGAWDSGRAGAVASVTGRWYDFSFADPVSAVGGVMNYYPSKNLTIQALAEDGSLLESYNIREEAPIDILGRNNGAFRGIVRQANDIAVFRIWNGGSSCIDDLAFTRSVIPEPSTIAIWSLLGLAGLMYGWRKRRKAA